MPAPSTRRDARRDRAVAEQLADWFRGAARPLPWRTPRRDPWAVLVSETMLQQTQAARVADRFERFLARFPTPRAMAQSSEDDVLALWSGLGYYRRARNLHAAARAIAERFDGAVPADPLDLVTLPGVGRYTAGAVASIAFGRPAPIVDGNVARVLLRLEGVAQPPDDRDTRAHLWRRAADLAGAAHEPGVFNEALMELGATVCTPRAPACDACPLRRRCVARREGTQHEIPPPKRRARVSTLRHTAVLVRDARGRILVEQRPREGLWAALWQPPALERPGAHASRRDLARAVGVEVGPIEREFEHRTTHRKVLIRVHRGWPGTAPPRRGVFERRDRIARLALANPHRGILLGAGGEPA